MPSRPTISVVIPSYNAAPYLAETLHSVFGQTYPVHEIIVVNDGSTDKTEEVLRSYSDKILIVKQENVGEGASRNAGIERSTGDWVAFLDADDIWHPTKLERQVTLLNSRSDLVCIHTWFYSFGTQNEERPVPREILREKYDIETLICHALVLPSSAMVRRSLQLRFLPWRVISIDMIYFAELSQMGRFACVLEPLVGWRKHPQSMTKQAGNWVRSIETRLRWIEEEFDPDSKEHLKRQLFLSVINQTEVSRWNRDWSRYWVLRKYLKRAWPWPEEGFPGITSETIYPPWVYRFKDVIERY